MDTGAGGIKGAAHEGGAGRNLKMLFVFKIIGNIGDDPKIHATIVALKLAILDHHGLQRGVARAFADAQQGGIDGRLQPYSQAVTALGTAL